MKKRILSLFCALVLCLGLLPATALAAAPDYQVIYVGGVKISSTGYWTTDSDGNVTAYTSGDTPTDNYIHYDVANNTLTLHNATIKESVSTVTSTFIAGAAIGVHNQNGAAELTITLEGTNTIAEVGKGIYVLASTTGSASLTITGDGSLDASASQTGIWVQSNNGNGALFIQNAKVEATGTSRGVNVQSHASSTASLTVDGGSLTASGSPGILYDSSSSGTVPKTTALTISNSAIVDARGGGIGAGLLQDLKKVFPADGSVGIVFDGNQSTVYGDVTLQEDLTIGEDESLTIPDGASLTIGNDATLTNEGTVTNSGTLTNNGTINNSGTLPSNIGGTAPPSITTTSPLASGTVGTEYSVTLEANNSTSGWSVTSGSLPDGLTLDGSTSLISGTPTAAGTYSFTVTATNTGGSDSEELSIKIEQAEDTTAPTLTAGSATRTGEATATVTFTSNEAGTYYYAVVESGATAPAIDTSGAGTACGTTEQTISLTNLTDAGAKDIYIVAKDAANNVSQPLNITIPDYVAPSYGISVDSASLNFGSVNVGYETAPTA